MTTRKELLEMFKKNTNSKVLVDVKVEPSKLQLVGYQYPRTNRYQLREKVHTKSGGNDGGI